jgi:hypothetical protein
VSKSIIEHRIQVNPSAKPKMKNSKWRMCIDFTDLNKCYLKDNFPLSRIDMVVDSAASCEMMVLLDSFSSYH